jgi:hypothetical protein
MRLRRLAGLALLGALPLTVNAQVPAPVTPDTLVTAAKRAAGADYAGTFLRICVAPDNLAAGGPRGGGPGPRAAGEKHPYETDTATVLRYFEMAANCAEAQRLLVQ